MACEKIITKVLGPNHPFQALSKDESFMHAISGMMSEDPVIGPMVDRQQFRKS